MSNVETSVPAVRRQGRPWFRRWSWVAVLAGGVLAYIAVLQVMVSTENINFFPSLLLIGSITVPVSVLVFAVGGGRVVRTRTSVVVFTAIVGGLVGTTTAGLLEYDTLRSLGTVPMVFVGLIEEAAKLLVPLVVFLVVRPRDPRDGVVIGIASGMGFATLETMGYGLQVLLVARSIAAVDSTLLLRALLSPACHIAWTGLTAAMLWRTASAPRRGRAVVVFLLSYLAAVALHATWDGSTSLIVHVVVASVGLVALLVLVHRTHRVPAPTAGATPGVL